MIIIVIVLIVLIHQDEYQMILEPKEKNSNLIDAELVIELSDDQFFYRDQTS